MDSNKMRFCPAGLKWLSFKKRGVTRTFYQRQKYVMLLDNVRYDLQ